MDKLNISSDGKKELLQKSEISIWIDSYEDIFSVFDSRPYSDRPLSVDFLDEMKRASRDKPSGGVLLNLLIPAKQRSFAQEALIKKRLKEHFKKHYERIHKEIKNVRSRGWKITLVGMIMMLGATYLVGLGWNNFLGHLLRIVLEPGGWFFMWTGLEHVLYRWADKKPDMEFYEKMSRADIVFHSY